MGSVRVGWIERAAAVPKSARGDFKNSPVELKPAVCVCVCVLCLLSVRNGGRNVFRLTRAPPTSAPASVSRRTIIEREFIVRIPQVRGDDITSVNPIRYKRGRSAARITVAKRRSNNNVPERSAADRFGVS